MVIIVMKQEKITIAELKRYVSLFEKSGVYWCCLLLLPGIEVLASAINALFYRKIINAVTISNHAMFRGAFWLAAAALALRLFQRLAVFTFMYHIRQIMARLRLRVMGHLFRLPMSYFEKHHTADSVQKLCFNVEDIKTSLANRHQGILKPVIMGISAIVLILMLDLRIGLMVVALSLISVRANMVLSKPLRSMSVTIQNRFASCTESLTDLLAGIDVIKMFPGARTMTEKYSEANGGMASAAMKKFRRMSDIQAVEWASGFLCNIVILLIGVFMSFAGMVDFGTVVAILSLQGMVSFFLSNIGRAWGCLIDSLVLADRVYEILDEPVWEEQSLCGGANLHEERRGLQPDRERSHCGNANLHEERHGLHSDREQGLCGIIMRGVDFSYDGSEKVLSGVDITVGRGKTAALVGESGGGKSTIVKLLLGFYPVCRGMIGVLGKPASAYSPEELRKNIAYVPQDAYLFATSIKENIRYGKPEADDEEVVAAAKRAYAHDFIMSFPDGYDTMVGERGESLSGGQRQRIAIARAFIRNAPILLLDEATSALDSESERLVQKGIEDLMGGRTTLVVAHRLSTIEKADMIYVIGGGKVCEKGTHDELMRQKGTYRRLVELSGRQQNN